VVTRVAATIRRSVVRGAVSPIRITSPRSSARNSFAWIAGDSSPISSRNSVPPDAASR